MWQEIYLWNNVMVEKQEILRLYKYQIMYSQSLKAKIDKKSLICVYEINL